MYNRNNYNNKFSFSNLDLKVKIILGIVLLIIIIITIILLSSNNNENPYVAFENQMILKAKEYVSANKIFVNDEIYVDMTKLKMNIKENCSQISGVFVDKNYQYQAYLSCDGYETDVIKNNDKAALNGKEVVLLAKGINYTETGVRGYYDVNISGEVGSEEGVYNLSYVVMNNNTIYTMLKRKVVIVDNIYVRNLFPTLTLKGEDIEYIEKGNQYIDKGVHASDSIDWDITNKVQVEGRVNTNNPGEYSVVYTVTNSRGYTNSITRKVIVIKNKVETVATISVNTTTLTNQNVTVTLKIVGEEYDHTVLPNGSISRNEIVTYQAEMNGVYNFDIYDKDGKKLTKSVEITNIKKEKPQASCTAQVYKAYARIYVTPYSNTQISSYNYIVNGTSTGAIVSPNYDAVMSNVTSVSVIIKDSLGNTNTISCNIDIKEVDTPPVVTPPTTPTSKNTYIDSKGKKCLEGFTCYNQSDYRNSNVPFCSTETCGTIAKRGCSITAFTTIVSGMGIRKIDGNPYNPEELVVQHFSKICSSYCSGSRALERLALRLGLSASIPYNHISKNRDVLVDFLKKGYPVMFRTGGEGSVYTTGGHLMAILGINEKGEVFLSDPASSRSTSVLSSKHKINDWVTIDEIISGAGDNYFQAICPKGACQGEEPDPGKYQNY